jgi:hypothetical protein
MGKGSRFSLLMGLGCDPQGDSPLSAPLESTPIPLTSRTRKLTEDLVFEPLESAPGPFTHLPVPRSQVEKSASSPFFKPLFPPPSFESIVIEALARKSDELMVIAKLLPPSILQGGLDSSKLRVLIVEVRKYREDYHSVLTI